MERFDILLTKLPMKRTATVLYVGVAFVVAEFPFDFTLVHAQTAQPQKALDKIVGGGGHDLRCRHPGQQMRVRHRRIAKVNWQREGPDGRELPQPCGERLREQK